MISIIAFASSVPIINATEVTLIKEHSPISLVKDPSETYDAYRPEANVMFRVHLNVSVAIKNLNFTDTLPEGMTYVLGSETTTPASSFTNFGNQTLFWDFGPGPFPTSIEQAFVQFNVTIDSDVPHNTFLVNLVTARYLEQISNAFSSPTTTDTIWIYRAIPDISLVKTPSQSQVPSGTLVTYTYVVKNIGEVPLINVNITDDTFGIITSGQTLAVDEEKTFYHQANITVTTLNIAIADGMDESGIHVTDQDDALVTVLKPPDGSVGGEIIPINLFQLLAPYLMITFFGVIVLTSLLRYRKRTI